MANELTTTRRESYLQELGAIPNSYQQWFDTLSADKQARVQARIRRIKHGLHAVAPLQCLGPGHCPFIGACPIPFHDRGKIVVGPESQYPIGQHCILEAEYIIQKIGEYLVHLEVDPHNPIELSIVQELGLIDLQKNRALLILAHGDNQGQGRDLMQVDRSVTGYADDGTPLVSETTKLHPALEHIDRLERRREKWLEKLMETRKAKADWSVKLGNNQAESQVLKEIQEMRKIVSNMITAPEPLALQDQVIGLDEQWEDK